PAEPPPPAKPRPKRARRQSTPLQRDPVVLAALVGAVVVIAYGLSSLLGIQWAVPSRSSSAATWEVVPESEAEQVRQGYAQYWRVIADAFIRHDPARLKEVTVGRELEITQKAV